MARTEARILGGRVDGLGKRIRVSRQSVIIVKMCERCEGRGYHLSGEAFLCKRCLGTGTVFSWKRFVAFSLNMAFTTIGVAALGYFLLGQLR